MCPVRQNPIRCCCGRLIVEHLWHESLPPPASLCPGPGRDLEEGWSVELHTRASPTDAYGTIDFQDRAARACRAKFARVGVDSKPEVLLQLMLTEWQMERPKLLLTVHGGSEDFPLPPRVKQAFSKGLMAAALSTGAWILTDGVHTGVSKHVGEAVKTFGGHSLRRRNAVGMAPWGVIDSNTDLVGRDVLRPYQPLGDPLSRGAFLNGFHSHFLLVDDGTLGKHGCQQGLRRELEKHIHLQKIHPRLNQGVPVVCVVVEGGPSLVSTVLDYVSNVPPVPVFVFEGSGRAADLIAFLHKQTSIGRPLGADIKEDFLVRIGNAFGVESAEASHLCSVLLQCMNHRESITIFDSESEDQTAPDAAILTTSLKGTKAGPAEQLGTALAWDRADIAQKDVLVYGQHWKVGSLEQAMLDALVMDRVSFVKLLIDNGMTMSRFLTVDRLEELYNMPRGQTGRFLRHLVEDAKQTSLPSGYRLSLVDVGLVMEFLMGGAYRSPYTRKHFRAAYSSRLDKQGTWDSSASTSNQRRGLIPCSTRGRALQDLKFFRAAQPYKPKLVVSPGSRAEIPSPPPPHGHGDAPPPVPFNFNDLFVWAILHQRHQMALFLCQHGEEVMARAAVAFKLYRSMAHEAQRGSVDDHVSERFRTHSLEFGQLAVDLLDCAFRQNEQMAMKLLTSEMEAWSHFTCLQMAVSSGHRPFVSHSCTQTLLTDLWTGPLNMRKNSSVKIILSLLLPPAILLLEFKSKAEMCHVPQSHEAMLFGLEPVKSAAPDEGGRDAERGLSPRGRCFGHASETVPSSALCLSWITRVYDFYAAPVVKFWFHTIFYLAFLVLFCQVVLVEMQDLPSVQEWLVIAYIVSTAVEKTREVLMSEPKKLSQKLKIWFSEYWNASDVVAILFFLTGLTLRWNADPYHTAGRIIYCLDIIFWFIRALDLLAVNQDAGPYLTMITKMTSNMFFIVVMMAIVLLSFGVSRKAILSPDQEPSWSIARDIVFMPYWMMYGEVYPSEECFAGDSCPPASFFTPFLQAVYMFVQYLIMVNILIASFNNIYFDMKSISNELWKYNRHRYIMTYQERPWLPPPLILLSHLTSGVRAVARKWTGDADQEERGSGLKLWLSHEDRKRLHEFEEKCVHAYFHEKSDGLHGSQISRIRATAERAEEMSTMVGDVSEKVLFIQDSLLDLDCQLGRLQDLSAAAVDTLSLLFASEEARLVPCPPTAASRHVLPRSRTRSWRRTPTSLLECSVAAQGSRRGRSEDGEEGRNQPAAVARPVEDWLGASRPSHPASFSHFHGESVHPYGFRGQTPRQACGSSPLSFLRPSPEETSVEEQEEEEEELSSGEPSRASSHAVLLSEPPHVSEGLVNPAFSQDDGGSQSRPGSPSGRTATPQPRGRPRGPCTSRSSSVEKVLLSVSPPPLMRGSCPLLHGAKDRDTWSDAKSLRDDASLLCSKERSKSSDFTPVSRKSRKRKTVKLQESGPETATSNLSRGSWRKERRWRGEPTCWSASTSLSRLNVEPTDLLKKDARRPGCPRSTSRRSPLQSGIGLEAKSSSFQSSENLYPNYSAVERNNLMRLAHTIPFSPVSIPGGEEVSVYSLDPLSPGVDPECGTDCSWSTRGLSAMLRPLGASEAPLGGAGGRRVLCTWAERGALTPGVVYVAKAFGPQEASLQLCLRVIQQQRAAQEMMRVFNSVKPADMHHSPRFLDVALVLWHSNGQWLTIERNMSGDFRKYNTRSGEEIAPCCSLEEMLLAFSHWTYEYSCRELLVLHMQGVGEELTDPTVLMADHLRGSRSEMLFGPDSLGNVAISAFRQKHSCGACCHRLGLADLRAGSEAKPTRGGGPEAHERCPRK